MIDKNELLKLNLTETGIYEKLQNKLSFQNIFALIFNEKVVSKFSSN